MGTMLQRAGLRPGELPELLALTNPALLTDIHRQYIGAGSQIVYANTFGANRRKLAKYGHTVDEVVAAAVGAAKAACVGTDVRVAVDIGPLGELLAPLGTLPFEEAVELFAEIAAAGERAGADLAVIETMTDLYETKAALLAVKESTSLPVMVTMTFEESGRTFTGCTVRSMCRTLEGLGADAIGLNCSLGPKQLLPLLREICENTRLPVIAKPNAGLPDPVDGHYDLTPAEFAAAMEEAVRCGVSIVGGCCGTDPAYIRALHDAVQSMSPGERTYRAVPMVCTPTTPVEITGVRVIGERINPTGKKRFQQALLESDLDYIVDVAIAQEDAGASILDVNVGYPGVDEVTMLPRVVQKLQEATTLPLQLDSTNPDALEAALRVYNGKAAVNSVNGDEKVLSRVLPIVKKYGAAVIGLTLDESGLPATAEERIRIAQRILDATQDCGIPKEDLWIDCLTLTVSAQQEQAEETLKAVCGVTQHLQLTTVLGVSNISFGLPNRLLMAQTFLIRAMSAGLLLPIINPNQKEMMDAVAAHRVLNGEDKGCSAYVERFAQTAEAVTKPAAASAAAMTLDDAIIRGLKADAAKLAKAAMETEPALTLVEKHLIPALDRVGAEYEAGKAFLPQLLSAAQAAQAVFGVIQDSIAGEGGAAVKKDKVIIATVKGDIHDIGKNIVRTVMENYGYDLIDLGRDVPPETIVETAAREKVRLVGLSALMTTTLPAMEETVRLLKAMPEPPAVMVGGAVVTEDYAVQMGADYYARDAKAAVEIARKVFA
ncbi:MAG: homocysteine S-methyltransferase family protein [Clostridia bacterium]|nr:homocysteine S-methyltransferase family protein [Clostridia bacterium]